MAAGTRPLILGFLFVLGFTFLLAGFVSTFMGATNPTSPLLTYQSSVLGNMTSSSSGLISGFQGNVTQSVNQLQNSKASPVQYLFLIVEAAFEIPKLFLGIIVNGLTLMTNLLFPSLGGSSIALSILLTMIITGLSVSIVFYLIKTLRTGESER